VPVDSRKLSQTLMQMVGMLVRGDYQGLEAITGGRHLKAEQIAQAIQEWPARLIMPPDGELPTLVYGDIVEVRGAHPAEYAVDVLLYTVEEGRSDLTLSLTLKDSPSELYGVEIDNLHVL
jgi:hypothetical protein